MCGGLIEYVLYVCIDWETDGEIERQARARTHTHTHTQVLELDKYNTHALHNRGISFDKLGLYHKALADLTEVEVHT